MAYSYEDVDEGGLTSETTALELTGFLTDGTTPIKGTDSVRIVPE